VNAFMPYTQLETRSCPVCRGNPASLAASEGIFQLYRCRCGMLYTRNPLTIDSKRDHYRALASSRGLSIASYHNLSTQIRSLSLYARVLQYLQAYLPRQKEIRLVDVGCAGGLFLLSTQVLEHPRLIACGLAFEPAEKAATEYHTGYPAYMLEEAGERLADWADVVTVLNVLEHVNHPDAFLETLRTILRPRGLLIADVPNNQVMTWKARTLNRWPPLDLGEHINHFTPRTLDVLLANHGFKSIKRLPGFVQGSSGFGLVPSLKQNLRWLAAFFFFYLTAGRLQTFINYTSIYRKENPQSRNHEA
jgi:2-polyprenyl-3-methyl-5-hydroxy-6-metoxy-1,4-benzoquinol methylase